MQAIALGTHPIHLGPGGSALAQPEFTGLAWYAGYVARHGADGAEGRLVGLHAFATPWDSWEMHPAGAEVVLCIAGACTLIQEDVAGGQARIALAPGDYAINPAGVWHTADTAAGASCVFITTGICTEHRPR